MTPHAPTATENELSPRTAWLKSVRKTTGDEPDAHLEIVAARDTPLPARPILDLAIGALPPEPFADPSKPRVVYQSAKNGPASGGTAVTILGNYFTDVTEVLFGDVRATSFQVVSSNRLVAVAPPHDAGAVAVRVATATAVAEAGTFTYVALPVVTQVKPDHAPTRGGTLIVVHGGNFVAGKTQVYFGKRHGKDVKVLSSRLLVVKAPPAEVGAAPLAVATPDGLSGEEAFEYV